MVAVITTLLSGTTNGVTMAGAGSFLYVGVNATVLDNFGVGVLSTVELNSVAVLGQVFSTGAGIDSLGAGFVLHVLAGGSVVARDDAFYCAGDADVLNEGTLSGYYGINAPGDVSLTNSGSIAGVVAGVLISGIGFVTNFGLISAAGPAISIEGSATVTNHGTIDGDLVTGANNDTLTNGGLITGLVALGAGDDLFDNSGGVVARTINLASGDDSFQGGAAAERVIGGRDADELSGNGGRDSFLALDDDGDDLIDGGSDIDIYDGRALIAGLGVNLLTGVARSGGATDLLTGIETVFGGAGADSLTGNGLSNVLRGQNGADVLAGGDGNDRLVGGSNNDSLYGGAGNDELSGGGEVDQLYGGDGDDLLTDGYDIDRFTGGAGADRFDFNDIEETFVITGSGRDRIMDFQPGVDVIDLSTMDADVNIAGNQGFVFVGNAGISDFAQVGFRNVGGYTVISVGVNTPTPLDIIRVDGVFALTAADFVL